MLIGRCPECDETVVTCDNNVRLSYPGEPRPDGWEDDHNGPGWAIMSLGFLNLACWPSVSDAPPTAHRLHEHQPPEE